MSSNSQRDSLNSNPSFTPILSSSDQQATGAAAAEDITASPLKHSKEVLAQVGSYLFSALNIVFEAYPDLDELGLILGMPTSGAGRKGDANGSKPPEFDPCLVQFHEQNPPPPALQQLQSANGSPPFIVMENSKLGISFWAIPFVLKHTLKAFQAARMRVKGLSVEEIVAREQVHLPLLQCTRILLLVNADNYTAWNARKLLLSCPPLSSTTPDGKPEYLLTPSTELKLLNLIYSKHPKSGESWNHRRWVLSCLKGLESDYHFTAQHVNRTSHRGKHRIEDVSHPAMKILPATTGLAKEDEPAATIDPTSLYHTRLFQAELRMCERSAELYPKNYFAWLHRQWLVERLNSLADLRAELERASEWTESHINDYCGFFHRQVVWNHWLDLLARNTASEKKGDQYARVHVNLVAQLRSWSKKYPSAASFSLPPKADANSLVVAASSSPSPAAVPSAASSDVSASTHAQSQLHSALASCSFCHAFSTAEWEHLNDLQLRYPGHETLWMHRRYVWQTTILAIAQHATPEPGVIPAWLQPLIHREMEYAQFQIRDRELSNYEANKTFATIYQVWVLDSALTIVYEKIVYPPTTAPSTAASSTFPLLSHLSSAHRQWYSTLVQAVTQLQPSVPARNHWHERGTATKQQQSQSGK